MLILAGTGKGRLAMTLDKLPIGQSAIIASVGGQGALRRRLLDMGLTPHTAIMVRKKAPMGDPIELHLRGYELTIRLEDAKEILLIEQGDTGHALSHNGAGGAEREE